MNILNNDDCKELWLAFHKGAEVVLSDALQRRNTKESLRVVLNAMLLSSNDDLILVIFPLISHDIFLEMLLAQISLKAL